MLLQEQGQLGRGNLPASKDYVLKLVVLEGRQAAAASCTEYTASDQIVRRGPRTGKSSAREEMITLVPTAWKILTGLRTSETEDGFLASL